MATEEERRKLFSEFLQKKRIELSFREGKMISQSELARKVGVAQGSLSQWEQGTRVPDDANAHKLASFFGPAVYRILEMPIMMPKDPSLVNIAEDWEYLNKDQKKKFANMIRDLADEQRERLHLPKETTGDRVTG
jgi:transcriptional regulator with XRE-family HTH domain